MTREQSQLPPLGDELPPAEKQKLLTAHGLAHNLKHRTGGSYLYAAAGRTVGPGMSPESFILYLDQLLQDAGNPQDPIERMMIEQIALAHHNIGCLYVRASAADDLDQAKLYNAAAARLLGEFRRTVLALKKYREPTPARNFMLVKQQYVAQNQQVAYVDHGGSHPGSTDNSENSKNHIDTELTSKGAIEHAQQANIVPQPESRGGRETQPVVARPVDA
jgi:hypothetical protein